jgi:7-carboxy-7-deazaguanine synthase
VTYTVHEIFYTLQGEGANAGRPAVFCRFAGCNLWTGREQDRADAVCQFCDTEFRGGTKYRTPEALVRAVRDAWPNGHLPRFVVFTGGEPLLQLDRKIVDLCHAAGFSVAVETNGTIAPTFPVD